MRKTRRLLCYQANVKIIITQETGLDSSMTFLLPNPKIFHFSNQLRYVWVGNFVTIIWPSWLLYMHWTVSHREWLALKKLNYCMNLLTFFFFNILENFVKKQETLACTSMILYMSQFCTCHNCGPVMTCANVWPNWIISQTFKIHYNDNTMSMMAFQITSLMIVYSTVYSGADQRKHQSSASLAFVRGIHRWPVNSPHKGPVKRKMFPFDDVIMLTIMTDDL